MVTTADLEARINRWKERLRKATEAGEGQLPADRIRLLRKKIKRTQRKLAKMKRAEARRAETKQTESGAATEQAPTPSEA